MKASTFLRTSLISIVTLLPVVYTTGARAVTPGEMQLQADSPDSDYKKDGKFMWLKTWTAARTYQESITFCNNQPVRGSNHWRIPDSEEMNGFYKRVIMTGDLEGKGWSLDKVWLTDQGKSADYRAYADLAAGSLSWVGQAVSNTRSAICVTQYIPNDVTSGDYTDMDGLIWSKSVAENSADYQAAQTYCSGMDRGNDKGRPWGLPTVAQLVKLYTDVISNKSEGIDFRQKFMDHGWKLGFTWAKQPSERDYVSVFMDATANPKGGAVYPQAEAGKNLVMCVR